MASTTARLDAVGAYESASLSLCPGSTAARFQPTARLTKINKRSGLITGVFSSARLCFSDSGSNITAGDDLRPSASVTPTRVHGDFAEPKEKGTRYEFADCRDEAGPPARRRPAPTVNFRYRVPRRTTRCVRGTDLALSSATQRSIGRRSSIAVDRFQSLCSTGRSGVGARPACFRRRIEDHASRNCSSDSRILFDGTMPAGTLHIAGPSQRLAAAFCAPCDFVHFHVSNSYLSECKAAARSIRPERCRI